MKASQVFTPAAPIDAERLFAGRIGQLRRVVDAVNQKGQHAIVFGERGVGKTSLANIISTKISGPVLPARINCDSANTYSSLWKRMFGQITFARTTQGIGFGADVTTTISTVAEQLDSQITPDYVRQVLASLSGVFPILIIDEFDRIANTQVKTAIADTIKTLSDHAIAATIVLVGVADSVDQLIEQHQSIERALVQIQMPRMSNDELYEILDNGLQTLEMAIDEAAKQEIAFLSRGLPHYAHLLGLHSVRAAVDGKSSTISLAHVEAAISEALRQAQQSIQSAYHKATTSARKDNIFSQVLLACALARTDDLAYFAAGDIRDPLRTITGRAYDIPNFSPHLYAFCEHERGPVLQKTGIPHRYRYRFINPLMQPYIVMQGKTKGLLDKEKLAAIKRGQK